MLRTTFSSIQDMLEYKQAVQSALEMLWEMEAEEWNNQNEPHDTLCDPSYRMMGFDEDTRMFLIPCWLSCEVTYTGGFADNDPYVPYVVEIALERVEDYLRENYGYD